MNSESIALLELIRVSSPGATHRFQHYLYLASAEAGATVAERLQEQGFEVESRPSADGVNWLVLATHVLPATEEAVAAARAQMEELAREHAGEYDGWEASTEAAP